MTRRIGLRAGAGQRVAIVAGGISAILLLVLLLVLSPGNLATIVPWVIATGSLALAAVAMFRARRLAAQAAKLSGDLDIVSLRLLNSKPHRLSRRRRAGPTDRLPEALTRSPPRSASWARSCAISPTPSPSMIGISRP